MTDSDCIAATESLDELPLALVISEIVPKPELKNSLLKGLSISFKARSANGDPRLGVDSMDKEATDGASPRREMANRASSPPCE